MIPSKLLDLIRRFEGLRLKPYLCPAGITTIGYGHTGPDVRLDMAPITEAVAEAMMLQDAALHVAAVRRYCPGVEGDTLAALADFSFNLGAGRLKSSTLRRKVNAGDLPGAQAELMKWVRGGGRILPGLVARRAAEVALLR